ncbi:hypothetical protein AKG43_06450 [Neisseria sp. 74A18]|nr:hypothetical protein AKG43_06450 [Neisseria sp. 74A18]
MPALFVKNVIQNFNPLFQTAFIVHPLKFITKPLYSGLARVSWVSVNLGDTRVKPEYDECTLFKLMTILLIDY